MISPQTAGAIKHALEEDIGPGDATTEALVSATARARARIVTRRECVACGMTVAKIVFRRLDPEMQVDIPVQDGQHVPAGGVLMELDGLARALLTGERTALNFLQRLCGIATMTRRYVEKVAPFTTAILDTRKTTPGLRSLEKQAVKCGGGTNHRFGLYDRVLIKDNHRAFWTGGRAPATLAAAVRAAREANPDLLIEIEVESEAELRDALEGSPDWVLLDNMAPADLKTCAALCRGRCKTEASGGITLENVAAVAATGVDAISIGALTHSAPAADLTLEFV